MGDLKKLELVQGGKQVTKSEPYGFSTQMEQEVLYLLVTDREFFDTIGEEIDGALLALKQSKLIVTACQEVKRLIGHGPGRASLVIEYLTQQRRAGKVDHEDIVAVNGLLDAIEDSGKPPERASTLAIVIPTVQRRGQKAIVTAAIEEYGKGGDFKEVQERLRALSTLGQRKTGLGTVFGRATFEGIERIRSLERLPLGIEELDIPLKGGLARGAVGVVTAGPSAGKSMFLNQIAGLTAMGGGMVLTATLGDLDEAMQGARFTANLCDVEIDTVLASTTAENLARVAPFLPNFGFWAPAYFKPRETTVETLRDWVRDTEKQYGRKVDLLVIDYLNKVGLKDFKGKSHQALDLITDELGEWCREEKFWIWTASQPKADASKPRSKKDKKVGDMDNIGESFGIVKNADLGIFIDGYEDDGGGDRQVGFHVYRNRLGVGRFRAGPFPTAFERGRTVDLRSMRVGGLPNPDDDLV